MDAFDISSHVRGRGRLYSNVGEHLIPLLGSCTPAELAKAGLIAPPTAWKSNLVMYDLATIIAQFLSTGEAGYKIGAMYIEYQNVADPEDEVAVPAFDRGDGISYYDALSDSGDTDYLRVPVIAAPVDSSDESLYPGGNRISIFTTTQGVVGVHGRPFSDSSNSKVFGWAVVATPDFGDATQDLIASRFYCEAGQQQVKLPTGQITVEHEITFA